MLISISESERLSSDVAKTQNVDSGPLNLPVSDEEVGIRESFGGLRRNGEFPGRFAVPIRWTFTEVETESYRSAFGAIARE